MLHKRGSQCAQVETASHSPSSARHLEDQRNTRQALPHGKAALAATIACCEARRTGSSALRCHDVLELVNLNLHVSWCGLLGDTVRLHSNSILV